MIAGKHDEVGLVLDERAPDFVNEFILRSFAMKMVLTTLRDLHDDKSGVSFIEYTALLGVILAVGLAVLTSVGTWATGVWTALCSAVNTGGMTCSVGA